MKIVRFSAERFKRLTAVEITPEGNTVVISGRNGQGKSSVLDAIWLALGGAAAAKDCGATRPVKDGEKDAVVTLDLGDIVVIRRWKADGKSSLEITSADGRKFSSPQSLLDSLIGAISFDPLAFSRMDSKEQRRRLIDLVHLEINPDELDAKRRQIYDERTIINREIKTFEAELSNIPKPQSDIPDEEISLADLLKELDAAQLKAAACVMNEGKLKDMREKATALTKEIAQKQDDLKKLVEDGKHQAELVKTQILPDLDGLKDKLANAEKINYSVRQKKHYMEITNKTAGKTARSETLSKQIEDIDKAKEDAFRKAKFPIDGLAFDEAGITFKGIPFLQCSGAERMKVCIAIAAALNPKIRVIRVADASLMDAESLKFVESFAAEQDIQVWLEKVSDGEKGIGITIEDGSVAE